MSRLQLSPYAPALRASCGNACREGQAALGQGLLVDDEPLVNNVCSELLSLLGYSVISANSGKDAVATYLAQGDDIDLVILDYMMPEMDGLKTFKLLKNADPTVKAIISSGYLADANITDLKQQGILDVISKPFTLDELKQVLENIKC